MKTILIIAMLSVAAVGCNSSSTDNTKNKNSETSSESTITRTEEKREEAQPETKPEVKSGSRHEMYAYARGAYEIVDGKIVVPELITERIVDTENGKDYICEVKLEAGEYEYEVDENEFRLKINDEILIYERQTKVDKDNLLKGDFSFQKDSEHDEQYREVTFYKDDIILFAQCIYNKNNPEFKPEAER